MNVKDKPSTSTAMVDAFANANDGRFNDSLLQAAIDGSVETPTEYTKRLRKETRDKSAGFTK